MFLYWYRDINGECIYVGITSRSIEERFQEHLKAHKQSFMYNVAEVYGYQLDLNRIEMEYVEQVAIRVLKPTQNKMIRSFEECFYKVNGFMRKLKDPAEIALLLCEQIEEVEELKGSIIGAFFWRTKEITKQTKHIKLIEEKEER